MVTVPKLFISANDYPSLHFYSRSRRCPSNAGKGHDACSQRNTCKDKRHMEDVDTVFLYMLNGGFRWTRLSPAKGGPDHFWIPSITVNTAHVSDFAAT